MLDGDLTIQLGAAIFGGWTSVHLHRSCEHLPNSFTIGGAVPAGLIGGVQTIPEGAPCQVFLGGDLALTGYADQVTLDGDASSSRVVIAGRGLCQDLVDCSAEPTENGRTVTVLQNGDIQLIAQALCDPYGIEVAILADIVASEGAQRLPAFGATLVDTPVSVLQRMARFYGVLLYEDEAGQVTFARAGATTAASGFAVGQNVEQYSFGRSMAERFSELKVFKSSVDLYADQTQLTSLNTAATATDPNVPRHRRMAIVSDAPLLNLAKQEAQWEVSKRAGAARSVTCTATGWRDAAGVLWKPNTLAPIVIPAGGLNETWIIADTTLIRDERGTRTEATLRPREAFDVEPINLLPANPDYVAEQGAA